MCYWFFSLASYTYLVYSFNAFMTGNNSIYDELKADFKSDKSKNKVSLTTYVVILLILFIPLCVFLAKRRPYSLVSNFDNLPVPVQVPLSGSTDLIALWKTFKIDYLASYDINWKVIAIKDFDSISDFSDKLSPKDFVLWWWLMWIQENIDKFYRYDNVWDSTLFATIKAWNEEWFDNLWWKVFFNKNYSNNRLIPSDKKIRLTLNKIKEWDEIRIKWFLSKIYLDDNSWSRWPSCISNSDLWCEIIYVTDVTWLREL